MPGGAASAAVWGLKQEAAEVTIYARDTNKAEALAGKFGVSLGKSLKTPVFAGVDVVTNATPLGTAGEFENQTSATAQQLRGARLAYDLVYNPTETDSRVRRERLAAKPLEDCRCWCPGG